MQPHEAEYRRIRDRAKEAGRNTLLRPDVLREIATYVLAELRLLGISDALLCQLSKLSGYESADEELARHVESTSYQAVMKKMWALAKAAGVTHEREKTSALTGSWQIYSNDLTKALISEVWRSTAAFRAEVEQSKKEREKAALERKAAKWNEDSSPPQHVGPVTLDQILGRNTGMSQAPSREELNDSSPQGDKTNIKYL